MYLHENIVPIQDARDLFTWEKDLVESVIVHICDHHLQYNKYRYVNHK